MVARYTLWKKEEVAYLEQYWGIYSIKHMAIKFGRSVDAVKIKAQRLGLGDARLHFDGITILQLSEVIGVDYNCIKSWSKRFRFPIKLKLFSSEQKVKVVYYRDLWKWLKTYKHVVDFSRIEPGIFGPEPEWMSEKRNADLVAKKKRGKPWSEDDDLLLKSLVNAHCYTYPEIAMRLQRTEGSVKRRLMELKIKSRPVRIDNHTKYTKQEVKQILDLYDRGYSIDVIAERLGKSALGVRGKMERMGYRFKGKVPIPPKEFLV
ncbi:helix-turn-helix domain-containing protein [Bacillus thuringiensis]|uniref:helix-turn-helix domain-containing protein n=1 Tax=Bacillus thuringiensis TaxID=1428 RepID=UPI000BF33AE3|nr:helix-turn-helix domain-containing protein [Bacillus thuringiensis]PFV44158.1 hypothetical protein COL03_09445 [Bacillus thuringiensis]